MPEGKQKYQPDPEMSLTIQAERYYGAQYIGTTKGASVLQTAERLGWPVGCNRKATEKSSSTE